MNRRLFLLAGLMSVTALAETSNLLAMKAGFANPSNAYTTAPLWVWNDMLTDEQIVASMRDLASQGVKQAFVHPRPGLMTPYLSDEWFGLWKTALAEADRLDMLLWIYDENSYPSGFAGGLVPEAMPESHAQSVGFKVESNVPTAGEDLIAAYRIAGDKYENVTAQVKARSPLPEGQYLVGRRVLSPSAPWHGGKFYVDLLRPGVTEKFLDITLDRYRRQIGERFGKRVPGSFTDEPHLMATAGGTPWTPDLPEVFRRRWGYDLMDALPSLVRNTADRKRARHDFMTVLSDLFIDRWAKPYHDYCEKNKLEFTGHYWDHNWPRCESVPDNMALYAWHQRPAIDCLMNQYREDTNAQFGNVRMVRELSSVANQMGRSRTLCEAYGAGGWDLRFEDMKRIGDWLAVLGVNTINEHLSYTTLRGARKHDHPLSFSYHEPWWMDYHVVAHYLTRMSYAMSLGRQVNRVLVIEPTTTAWMYQFAGDAAQKEQLKKLGDSFFATVMELERAQVEYDLGCEDIIGRHGRANGPAGNARLTVGQAAYTTVVIPALTETLNAKTVDLLEQFVAAGGRVVSVAPAPALVDARPSNRLAELAKKPTWEQADQLPIAGLKATAEGGFSIDRAANDAGILFHQRRQWPGGQLVLLVNTSLDQPSSGTLRAAASGVEMWNPQTGEIRPFNFEKTSKGVNVPFTLPPSGSLLLNFTSAAGEPAAAVVEHSTPIKPAGDIKVHRLEPNVLTVDYVDVSAGDETKTGIYYDLAARFVFTKHGLKGNPWSQAVQFRDELIKTTFPKGSGFEVTYRFTVEGAVPKDLSIVVERADLYTITCNGQPISAVKGAWWLDRSFNRIDLTTCAKVGENAVTLKAAPMTIYHEIEPVYVLGDFSLQASAKGFVVAPPTPLAMDKNGWNEQGHPFYAAGVGYSQSFQVAKPQGRYLVSLPDWYGSVARVIVNGEVAGRIFHQPSECDVTSLIRPGDNTIEVVIVGTLKNTLGPHHGNPPLGAAWPAGFRKAPAAGPPAGKDYHTVGYGLRGPFTLKCALRE